MTVGGPPLRKELSGAHQPTQIEIGTACRSRGSIMQPQLTDWIQAFAASVTMIAAIAALIIASKAPRLAAKFAEDYRRQSAVEDELKRFRALIFQSLMKHRHPYEIFAQDARAAINLIDVAFADDLDVRAARRSFIEATERPNEGEPIEVRYHALIAAVSKAMGFSDRISDLDVRNGYYPTALGTMDQAAVREAAARLAAFNKLASGGQSDADPASGTS